ncbi:MAG: hypothetical protein N2D54_11735, partial [Chloroflexota bacterium]
IAMLSVLLLVALAETRTVSSAWFTLASALTLGTTVTKWMAGILGAWSRHTRQAALQISANAFSIIVVLWAVQKYFFADSKFFLGGSAALQRETGFIDFTRSGGLFTSAKAFLFHSMVMPEIQIVNMSQKAPWLEMSVQQSVPGSSGWLGLIAVAAWVILLTIGISTLFNSKTYEKFRLTLGLLLVGQFGLHLFYGNETLLYSLHYLPFMLFTAALGSQTRWRMLVLVLAGMLLITGLLNNMQQFQFAMDFFDLALGAP